jgi:arsenate reductase
VIKMYGIPTCGSVKKAKKFFNDNEIEFQFIDFKKTPATKEQIENWLKQVSIDKLFNNRGTKYRTLKLKDLNLDDEGKKEWLFKENLLIKRPIIEFDDNVIVAFDEDEYKNIFLK